MQSNYFNLIGLHFNKLAAFCALLQQFVQFYNVCTYHTKDDLLVKGDLCNYGIICKRGSRKVT